MENGSNNNRQDPNRGTADGDFTVPKNMMNALVLGVIAAAGALVWNTVVAAPKDFGVISQQTAEIRTTVLEMKGTLSDITTRLENNTKATADQQARISGLEAHATASNARIERLEDEVRRGR